MLLLILANHLVREVEAPGVVAGAEVNIAVVISELGVYLGAAGGRGGRGCGCHCRRE